MVRSVPRLRAQFRRDPRRARLPGPLPDRSLDAIGQQLVVYAEIDAALEHLAGWTPAPGTWKLAGEQIRYPRGHFCQLAMERLDTVLVADLAGDRGDRYPPPSAESMATAIQVKMRSVVAAPLYARESLLGVLAVARSDLTSRTDRSFTPADRDLISAVAGQIAIAIDNAVTARRQVPDHPGSVAIAPATR